MKKLLLVLGLVLPFVAYSQSTRVPYNRYCFWTETVINGVIKDKWKYQLDYQYRTTSEPSNVQAEKSNMFSNPFQHVYRPWIHYQASPKVRLSLSPIGFWESYYSAAEGGGKEKIQPEFRICPQITLSDKIGKVSIDQRYRLEYRLMGQKVDYTGGLGYSLGTCFPDDTRKYRMWYFVRATVPLTEKFYVVTWNELFVAFGNHTADNKIWDQNRTFCLLGVRPKMSFPMRFELGYGLQYTNRYTSKIDYVEKNNILQVYVIVENLNKLFKK